MTPQVMSGSIFGLGVLSSVLTGFGKYSSGQQQQAAYDYNAQITLETMRDQVEANQQKTSSLIGRQASSYAASGVDIASGSPLLVMAATAARGARQGEQIREQGEDQAALQRYYGKIAAYSGTMGGIGSFLSGITQASTGYYNATSNPKPSVQSGGGNIPTGGDWD